MSDIDFNMADKHKRLNLTDIPDNISIAYVKNDVSLRRKQKASAFVSGSYINDLKFFSGNEYSVLVRGEVHPSQRKSDPCHVVNLEINTKSETLDDAHCKCQQGDSGSCSHILAVIMFIEQLKIQGYKDVPAMMTCTSLPQEWDKPRGEKITPEPVSQMVLSRPTNVKRKRRPVMAEYVDMRKISVEQEDVSEVKKLKSSSISYLIEQNTESTKFIDTMFGQAPVGSALSYHGPLIEPVSMPVEQCSACGVIAYPKNNISENIANVVQGSHGHWEAVSLSLDEAVLLEGATRRQNDSKKWHEERSTRLTASNFGAIMTRQKTVNETFLKNTFSNLKLCTKPTSYGNVNEKNAKKMYINTTKSHLHDIGLVVNPAFPFLGASPDAIVCCDGESGILEVKCPYAARDLTISEAVGTVKGFCLQKSGETLTLKKNHKHYYQVQGQLLVTGASFCDFVVYTRNDLFIERIKPDENVIMIMLQKLKSFYIDHFKPFVTSKQNAQET